MRRCVYAVMSLAELKEKQTFIISRVKRLFGSKAYENWMLIRLSTFDVSFASYNFQITDELKTCVCKRCGFLWKRHNFYNHGIHHSNSLLHCDLCVCFFFSSKTLIESKATTHIHRHVHTLVRI